MKSNPHWSPHPKELPQSFLPRILQPRDSGTFTTTFVRFVLMVIRISLVLCLMSPSQAVDQAHQLDSHRHFLKMTSTPLQNEGACVESAGKKGITVTHAQTRRLNSELSTMYVSPLFPFMYHRYSHTTPLSLSLSRSLSHLHVFRYT